MLQALAQAGAQEAALSRVSQCEALRRNSLWSLALGNRFGRDNLQSCPATLRNCSEAKPDRLRFEGTLAWG
jgi:hypothetical protein